ncbi:COMPASS (complex proteins associated with Set1p) component [Sporothrix bragantina]|uniref:COMPASS (Complex proteins associated with Set1p) component n=1 Tax=Sporothrix bragantina TaxID=671064 RepID=A0ABP0BQ98_9PEZI
MPASSAASHASRSPSPLSTSYSQDSLPAEFTGSYFAPVGMPSAATALGRLSSVDSDVHMTDMTDGTADNSAASYRPRQERQERQRSERNSSPLSNASTTGTSAAAANSNSNNRKRSLTSSAAASSAVKRGGSSIGGMAAKQKKTATSRGGSSSANMRGGSGNSSSGVTRPKKGVAIPKPSKPKNGTENRRLSKSTLSSPSPRRIKRELDSSDDDNDDDRDNHLEADDEDDDLEDLEDDRSMDGGLNGIAGTGSGIGDGPGIDGNTSDNGPYCICRGPDDHRWMIQCDDCEDWFHGDCVNINKDDGENMMLSYICPNCTIPGRYVTRYRRLCSLPGCRRAARLYGEDGMSPAEAPVLTSASATASHFCSDSHRDQWWDNLLGQLPTDRRSSSSYGGGTAAAAAEAKMAVDLFTPTQLLAVLAHTDQPGVAQMLLQGLVSEHHQNKLTTDADLERRMTVEERETTQKSAADRYHLAEQIVMCKKMLQLLDMTKTRSQEAIKAGLIERDSCGYDERLQHVGVQPHFQQFLASPEGVALYRGEKLQAPQFDNNGRRIEYFKGGRVKSEDDGNDSDSDSGETFNQDTAGMCGKRKCKSHASWFSTLARDVRMQMHEFTRQAAALRDNETRIRLAAIQRSFVKEHSAYEVRYVGDSDNSLTSLASDSDYDDDDDEDEDEDDDESDDNCEQTEKKEEQTGTPLSEEIAPPMHHILNEDDDEDMVDLVGYGDDSEDEDRDTKNTATPLYNGGYSRNSLSAASGGAHETLRRKGHSPNTDGTVSD